MGARTLDSDPYVRARVMVIAEQIASQMAIAPEVILGRSRLPRVVLARGAVMAALWRDGCSIAEIGGILGMHHTSVMHALRNAVGSEAYRAGIIARQPHRGVSP